MSDDIEDIVAMARAAQRDERLSDGPLYGKLADEITRLRSRVEVLERTLTRTSANLMAAISLLKAGGRDAAPSDKMFRQMLNDYEKAAQNGREKLLEAKP